MALMLHFGIHVHTKFVSYVRAIYRC